MSTDKPRKPYPEKGGHASTDATIYDLPPLPAWVVQTPDEDSNPAAPVVGEQPHA